MHRWAFRKKYWTKRKKSALSIWSKTTSKIDLNAREIPFKIHQTLQIFRNILIQYCNYQITHKKLPNATKYNKLPPSVRSWRQISFPATDVRLQNAPAWANVPGQWPERGNQACKWLTHNIGWLQTLIHRRVESASFLAYRLLHARVKGISVSSLG